MWLTIDSEAEFQYMYLLETSKKPSNPSQKQEQNTYRL